PVRIRAAGRARRLASIVLVVALGALAVSACGPPPPPEPLAPTTLSHGHTVSHEVRTFYDTSRVIAGLEWVAARPLGPDLWHPAGRRTGPYPLLVFAQGCGVGPSAYSALLQRIASAGYVVAAPQYPVLSGWPWGPSDVEDWDEHYADTSFVIDQLFVMT